jgi:hypothetical protein
MGKEEEALLLAMSIVAHDEAHKHLSEAGREVLEMIDYAGRNSGLSMLMPTWKPAPPPASLSTTRTSSRRISRGGR